jgi:hypothetical protein
MDILTEAALHPIDDLIRLATTNRQDQIDLCRHQPQTTLAFRSVVVE